MTSNSYDTIAYIIIGSTILFVLYRAFKKLSKNKSEPEKCNSGCSGCSTPCELKDLTRSIK